MRQQLFPLGKVDVVVEHHQCGEETLVPGVSVAGLVPQCAHLIADGMETKGNEVQSQQQIGPSLVPMAEVVFHVQVPISVFA